MVNIHSVGATAQSAAGFVDGTPDLAPLGPRPIKLLQSNNPEVMRGHQAYVPGAEGGDFLVPRAGEMVLYKGTTGIEVIFVGFEECFLEWPAIRGAGSGGPLDRHPTIPTDANWVLDPSTGGKVCLRANGNKVEKTIYGHALIDGAPATFVFRSTAYPIGHRLANLAFHANATIDGEEIRVVGAKWRVTSRLESNDRGSWSVPQIDLIGKFGTRDGPTLEEARTAKAMRIALKTGTQPPVLEAPKTLPPTQIQRGSTRFTTGRDGQIGRPPTSDERSPPPVGAVDDDIPF
jgi:hypothetical protein